MTTAVVSKRAPVVWQPTEKQAEFLACPARECLFGGSLGCGKSQALLMAAVAQTGNKNHRALILRRTFPMLRDLIDGSHALFLPLGARFNKQTSQWRFPSGAIIEFGFLDADEDKYRYLGRQFSFIGWDELTQWPNPDAYIFLLSRLRTTEASNLRLEVRATCCPGGLGHSWVKSRFNVPDDGSASECRDAATGYRRVFIAARIADNPHLRGSEYERQLQALPETTRRAYLEGFWNVFEGAVFSEWNPRAHICEPFPIPETWEIWRGADDGYASPACVLWFARDGIHDRIYVVQELYERGLTAGAMAEAVLQIDKSILRRCGQCVLENGSALRGIIDSASFADIGNGSRADAMNKLRCGWQPCEKGAGSRVAGINAIHQRLAPRDDNQPGLKIFTTCRNLIRTLPSLCYSKSHPEDVDTVAEDHAFDALRYGLAWKRSTVARVRVV